MIDSFVIFCFILVFVIISTMKAQKINRNAPQRNPQRPPRPQGVPSPSPTSLPHMDLMEMLENYEKMQKDLAQRIPEQNAQELPSPPAPDPRPQSVPLDQAFAQQRPAPLPDKEPDIPMPAPVEQPENLNEALVTKSLAKAFPAAVQLAKDTRPGIHRPIRIQAKGRSQVRQAVIMSEVLARPRAFDL